MAVDWTHQYFPTPNERYLCVHDPYSLKGALSSQEDRVDAQLNAEARMRLRPRSYNISWQCDETALVAVD